MTTATASPVTAPRRFTIGLGEILNFAYDAFCSNKLQFTLTALAMAVGTASVILVATIGLTRKQVPSVVAASPTVALGDRISLGAGRQRDILLLGVDPDYLRVRNLVLLAGRFFDSEDSTGRNKVGLITLNLAQKLYGAPQNSIGKVIELSGGLPFTIIGVFRESVDTFG